MIEGRDWMRGILVGLVVAPLVACGAEEDPRPPNLVIVALDTLRPDHLGCYGYELDTSPNIDAFAAGAFRFTGAQSAAPWTAPSMITLMTSLYPDVHQVMAFPEPGRLGSGVETLAEVLQSHGFGTAAFTEGGYAKGTFGLDQGFDFFPASAGDEESHTSNTEHPSRLAQNIDRFLPWLAERPAQTPFFAFFQTYEPHHPLRAPEEYVRRFVPGYDEEAEHARIAGIIEDWAEGSEFDFEEGRLLQHHFMHCKLTSLGKIKDQAEFAAHAEKIGTRLRRGAMARDPELIEWINALYDAEVRYTDDQMQRIFDALETNGQAQNTVVLIVSDHGEGLGDHNRLSHGHALYEEQLNVVFLLRVPGEGFTPRVIDFPARTVDVMPTVLDLLGISAGDTPHQGRSLGPLLAGEDLEIEPSFSHGLSSKAQQHSVRTSRWRLIVDDESGAEELYDLETDPGELENLAESRPEKLAELRALLDGQRREDELLRDLLDVGLEGSALDEETLRELERLGYIGEE